MNIATPKFTETLLSSDIQTWDNTSRQMTSVGTGVVAIGAVLATIASAGAAGAAVGAAASTGATAVGATAATAATTASIASAATTATLSTIASTIATTAASASVSMNGGLSNLDDVAKTTWDNTTSKDAFKSYAISALTAGATQGITNVLNNMTNGAITAGNASNATLTQKFTTALYESAISTTTNTAVQSAINGDSFKDTLKQQAINTGVGAIANLGAKEIGSNFKNCNILHNNKI